MAAAESHLDVEVGGGGPVPRLIMAMTSVWGTSSEPQSFMDSHFRGCLRRAWNTWCLRDGAGKGPRAPSAGQGGFLEARGGVVGSPPLVLQELKRLMGDPGSLRGCECVYVSICVCVFVWACMYVSGSDCMSIMCVYFCVSVYEPV